MKHASLFIVALGLSTVAGQAAPQQQPRLERVPVRAPELVSLSSAGVLGNSWSGGTTLSATGRYCAYHSYSTNLVAGDTNSHYDIFVHDLSAGVTERVSVSSFGLQANGSSVYPSISAEGRLVAFVSHATNLVSGDVNGVSDIFLHDRARGITRLVSRSTAGAQAAWNVEKPALSADGRLVAFQSFASNLAPDSNGLVRDIFVHDVSSGETALVSIGHLGQAANQNCDEPSISGDGRLVAFHSASTNLVPGDSNGFTDVFVRDRLNGTTVRVSVDSAGLQATSYSFHPAISGDGRYVAFQSAASLVPGDDDNGFFDVYVHDLATGRTQAITAGAPTFAINTSVTLPSISRDGRRVGFQAAVIDYPNVETSQVFVHDRVSGVTIAASSPFGVAGNGDSSFVALSLDGRVIGFESRADNLVREDTNDAGDSFAGVIQGP